MPIFEEYGGPTRERGYYSAADWAKLQNPDWAKSQEEYDAFAAQAAARAANNAAAMSRAREAIPYSYTQFGQGSTEPVFSLSGFAGQSGGGTAGLAGFAGTGGPTGTTVIGDGSTSTTDGGTTDGGSSNPRNNVPRTDGGGQDDSSNPRGDVYQKAEGGVVGTPSEISEEERYGTIAPPDYPILARGAEAFRTAERALEGNPAQFFVPGSGVAQVFERWAYGEDPSAAEYGMAALDVADVAPITKGIAGVAKIAGMLLPGKKISDYMQRGFIGVNTARGNPNEITEFDPGVGGTFVALNPTQANTYAPEAGGAVIPVRVDTDGFADVYFEGTGWNDPNGTRTLVDDATGEEIDLSGLTTTEVAKQVKDMGYPGVRMIDVYDPGPNRTGVSAEEFAEYERSGDSQVVVFDNSRIIFDQQPKPVEKAEGGVILPDLYMAQGGVIESPYANSILPPVKPQMQAISATPPTMQVGPPPAPQQGGIGGLFQQLHSRHGPQMGMNQGGPLAAYRGYLQETYVNPQAQDMANKVSEFVDLVSNAERAHFGAQDQMGPMGQMQPQMQSETPMLGGEPMRSWSMPLSLAAPRGDIASLQLAQQSAMGG